MRRNDIIHLVDDATLSYLLAGRKRRGAHADMSEPETRGTFSTQFPISPGLKPFIQLQVPRPMTSDEWRRFMNILEAMRPGLVSEAEQPAYSEDMPYGWIEADERRP